MQPILFPRLDRVRNTSVMSSSRCEYWNSARSARWSFHLPSTAPETVAPFRTRMLDTPVVLVAGEPASGSGRKAYVGSGGRKASLAAMRPGQGGQQNRQHSSLRERPFILHYAGGWQKDHCAIKSHINRVFAQWLTHYQCNVHGKCGSSDENVSLSVLSQRTKNSKPSPTRGWNRMFRIFAEMCRSIKEFIQCFWEIFFGYCLNYISNLVDALVKHDYYSLL